MKKILAWDLPTRLGHWLLASGFILSFFSGDSEELRLVHIGAGSAVAGILVFRLFWGIAGTRYARFNSFLFSPSQVWAYLTGLLKGKPEHWIGHNPAGSYAIFALLLLAVSVVGSGCAEYLGIGGDPMEEAHDMLSYSMLGMVCIHLTGVVAGSYLHRENLVLGMVTGYKHGSPEDAISPKSNYWVVLLLLLTASASLMVFAS